MGIRSVLAGATCATAVLGLATSALAQNDGHLDGVWMQADFKAKVNLVDYSGPPPWTTLEKVKLQTAEDHCYVVLDWDGPDSYQYDAISICQDASGDWDWLDDSTFYEIGDGEGSIADDWAELEFLAEGDDFDDDAEFDTEGFLKLTPKIKDGVVEKVKLLGNKGKKTMAYREVENGSEVYGTGKGKLKLKVVPEAEVPAGAQEAYQDWLE